MTTSTTSELAALRLVLQLHLRMCNLGPVVLLTGSGGASLQLAVEDRARPFVREVASLCRCVEDVEWTLYLQWTPPHSVTQENKQAHLLAVAAHVQVPSITFDRYHPSRGLIQQNAPCSHPHPGVACGQPPTPVPPRGISKLAASLLHRLRLGYVFTQQSLHIKGKCENPLCATCNTPEDIPDILFFYLIVLTDKCSPRQ